jgi:hypothetical protein
VSWSKRFDESIPSLATSSSRSRTQSSTSIRLSPNPNMVTRKMLHPATALAHAAEGRDFVMHARIAVIQAPKRNDGSRPIDPARKE